MILPINNLSVDEYKFINGGGCTCTCRCGSGECTLEDKNVTNGYLHVISGTFSDLSACGTSCTNIGPGNWQGHTCRTFCQVLENAASVAVNSILNKFLNK